MVVAALAAVYTGAACMRNIDVLRTRPKLLAQGVGISFVQTLRAAHIPGYHDICAARS